MKIVAYIAVALVLFCGTLVALLALTGNLNKESIERLVKGPPEAAAAAQAKEDSGALARALRERQAAITAREKDLDAREKRLEQLEADIETERANVEQLLAQIQDALDTAEGERGKRKDEVASSLAEMDAAGAAKILESWPDTGEAAEILLLIKAKDRGKILDEIATNSPTLAAELLREVQQPKI